MLDEPPLMVRMRGMLSGALFEVGEYVDCGAYGHCGSADIYLPVRQGLSNITFRVAPGKTPTIQQYEPAPPAEGEGI